MRRASMDLTSIRNDIEARFGSARSIAARKTSRFLQAIEGLAHHVNAPITRGVSISTLRSKAGCSSFQEAPGLPHVALSLEPARKQ